jgi:hypothetical protein
MRSISFAAAALGSVAALVGFVDAAEAGTIPNACKLEIEVNALRVPGRDIQSGANQTESVTVKARILKGTAETGTTIDTTLTVEAFDGTDRISATDIGPIRLGIGKGGKGAKVVMSIPRCTTGFIEFVATFSGVEATTRNCEGSRALRKACRDR